MAEIVYETGSWIYKILFTLIIASICIFVIGRTISSDLNTSHIQESLMLNRILYAPDGFWDKENGITIPGTVNIEQFTDEVMKKNFVYHKDYGAAKISLIPNQGPTTVIGSDDAKIIYINKPTYDNFERQMKGKLKSGGRISSHSYPIVIRTGTTYTNGYLVIQIAMPERA